MDGIHIPQEIADAEGVPDDLDSAERGPYRFPNPIRRRNAACFYFGAAVVAALGVALGLPTGMLGLAAGLIAIGFIHRGAAWNLAIEQGQALESAATHVPFAVGHASAAVAFVGLRAKPIWHVIVYSAVEPPDQRALVRLDATTGAMVDEVYVEALDAIEVDEPAL
jgi:hypothetical protein